MPESGLGSRLPDLDYGLFAFYLVCVAVLTFILLPVFVVFFYSFFGSAVGGLSRPTLEFYEGAISNNLDAIILSIQIAVITVIVDIIVGVPAAYTLVRYEFPFKRLLTELTILPMAIPGIVIGVAIVRSWGAPRFGIDIGGTVEIIIIGHILFTIPFVIQVTMATLESIDYRRLEESARSLGAGWLRTFVYVIIPNIYSGIIAGSIMAFALSLGEFNISFFVYTPQNTTLPIALFGGFRTATVGEASALASIFILLIVGLLLIVQLISDEGVKLGGNV
ncbi:ABC transporter permease subunit [Natrarchaeobius halalkaliphilus]|uniref:ABC transporter permease subunit n=1 Tax=Natrarchaeobius halalkaliphilus TaxID=1679091 RepID=A0A3N6M9M6_9EURY|nr:ABC transporter permease subunit [Natrarchaeobius halalkaliphilus]RQG93000.1 ABC transporter permease subunit [Natrarchaeobius halalkaliphilus]